MLVVRAAIEMILKDRSGPDKLFPQLGQAARASSSADLYSVCSCGLTFNLKTSHGCCNKVRWNPKDSRPHYNHHVR